MQAWVGYHLHFGDSKRAQAFMHDPFDPGGLKFRSSTTYMANSPQKKLDRSGLIFWGQFLGFSGATFWGKLFFWGQFLGQRGDCVTSST